MEYAALISYIDPNDATNVISIILDTVNDTSVMASSTVTQHPTIDGTPMADHMYRDPTTLSISGVFSLNGKKAAIVDKSGQSLARVEEIFEDIKNKGILCTVTKIKIIDNDHVPQFAIRDNMVLQHISWTERTNSLSFSLSFTEALRANTQTYDTAPDDAFLPNVQYPNTSSFTDVFIDWNEIDTVVLKALKEYNLLEDAFAAFISALGVSGLVGFGLAFGLATVLTAISLSVPVVGAILAGITFITLTIVYIVKKFYASGNKAKAFKYYSEPAKRENEVKRFINFYADVHNTIQKSFDGKVKVWHLVEDRSQEAILNIDNNYYIFSFERNNVGYDFNYNFTISDIEGNVIKSGNTNGALRCFTAGNKNNALFMTDNYYVYLMRADQYAEYDEVWQKYLNLSDDERELLTIEDYAKYYRHNPNSLHKCYICASKIDPTKFDDELTRVIQSAIVY